MDSQGPGYNVNGTQTTQNTQDVMKPYLGTLRTRVKMLVKDCSKKRDKDAKCKTEKDD